MSDRFLEMGYPSRVVFKAKEEYGENDEEAILNAILTYLFNNIFNAIFSSPPMVAMIVATLLDNTLEAWSTHEDRGIPWRVPFQHKRGDSKNEEFYSYPLRFREYIPSRFL